MPMTKLAHIKMLVSVSATMPMLAPDRTSQAPPARTRLAAGPASATMTDRAGVAVKFSNWVWPPQRFSTIFWVGQP